MAERRLKIAMFSDSALPVLNGVSISLDLLIQELRNRGHSVHLFAPRHPGHVEKHPNTYRFRAIETPWSRGYPIAYPPFYRKLHRFKSQRFDIVHSHTPFILGFVGLRWAESYEVPIVSTYHTLYDRYAHYLSAFPRRYIRFRVAKHTHFYYNSVRHVITPSEVARKWLVRHGVETPIDVIPTGSMPPVPHDRSLVRQELGFTPDQHILLYTGRLAKEKNLETLLRAAKLVFQADPNSRLVLVGDGPYRESLIQSASLLGIGDRIRFEGFVPRDSVGRYYAAADLFTFPSVTETQGLVVQEALQYRLPAVAIAGGGASEAIRDGIDGLSSKNDPEHFASDILRVLTEPGLRARLERETHLSMESRSVGKMVNSVLAVYAKVLASTPEVHADQGSALR